MLGRRVVIQIRSKSGGISHQFGILGKDGEISLVKNLCECGPLRNYTIGPNGGWGGETDLAETPVWEEITDQIFHPRDTFKIFPPDGRECYKGINILKPW